MCNSGRKHPLKGNLKFEDIKLYDLSVYHYNLNDKDNCMITDLYALDN